jgi:1-hydroxycarotenoid 3,4-desaturase
MTRERPVRNSEREKAVVVGAGLGGLSAALCLAQAGLDVTVVERLGAPGGKLRAVPSLAGPVDAGPTVLTLRGIFDDLFAQAGARLSDHVTLVPEPILARHWWPDGARLDLHADPASSEAAIRDFAGPRAASEFRAFNNRAARLYAAFDAPMMRSPDPDPLVVSRAVLRHPSLVSDIAPSRTLAAALDAQFRDPRLRQLFGRYATYVGGSPYESPALLALIWRAEAGGVWRIAGGMHALARAMADLAAARGVRFLFDTAADRVELARGAVCGVGLADGGRLPAARVVFNGDPRALTAGLFGPALARCVPEAATEPRSLSASVWSFAAKPHGVPLLHHNVFFCRDPRAEFDALAAGRAPSDPTHYVCAQDRGAGLDPTGLERFEIISNSPPAEPGGAPDETEFARCQTRTFAALERMGLTFSPLPDRAALTTPGDFAALFPGSNGALYGRSPHGLMASFRRNRARTTLPGLYLAGGGVHPGPGMPMAALSGRHAAAAILADLAST